jgi:hypothetical protein
MSDVTSPPGVAPAASGAAPELANRSVEDLARRLPASFLWGAATAAYQIE